MDETMTCHHCGQTIETESLQDGERCPHCGEVVETKSAVERQPVELPKCPAVRPRDSIWLSLAAIMLGLGIFLVSAAGLASEYMRMESIWPMAAPIGALSFLIGALISIVNSIRMRRRVNSGYILGGAMLAIAGLLIASLYVLEPLLHASRYPGLFRGAFLAIVVSLIAGSLMNTFVVWSRVRVGRIRSVLHGGAFIMAICGAIPVGFFAVYVIMHPIHDCDPDGVTRALGDCRNISTAIHIFNKDTGTWPMFTSARHSPESRVDYLYGNMGVIPEFSDEARESWGSRSEDMYFTLVTNGRTAPWYPYGREVKGEDSSYSKPSAGGWAGPYLPYVTDNRQGFAYLISVSGLWGGTKPDNHVWCLSAGVNGIVETPAWATETHGDDVGYRYDY